MKKQDAGHQAMLRRKAAKRLGRQAITEGRKFSTRPRACQAVRKTVARISDALALASLESFAKLRMSAKALGNNSNKVLADMKRTSEAFKKVRGHV